MKNILDMNNDELRDVALNFDKLSKEEKTELQYDNQYDKCVNDDGSITWISNSSKICRLSTAMISLKVNPFEN